MNRNVFNLDLNISIEEERRISSGRRFQYLGPATENRLSPYNLVLDRGTINRFLFNERNLGLFTIFSRLRIKVKGADI